MIANALNSQRILSTFHYEKYSCYECEECDLNHAFYIECGFNFHLQSRSINAAIKFHEKMLTMRTYIINHADGHINRNKKIDLRTLQSMNGEMQNLRQGLKKLLKKKIIVSYCI